MKMTILAAIAAVLTSSAITTHVEAATTAQIAYGDIDLYTEKGQRLLSLRVTRAADELCDDLNARYSAKVRLEVSRCKANVAEEAQRRLQQVKTHQSWTR